MEYSAVNFKEHKMSDLLVLNKLNSESTFTNTTGYRK